MADTLNRYLGRSDALAALQAHAARLARIDALFRRSVPSHLAASCAVANLKDGTLVVLAESGAAAAKLKQALPTVIERLAQGGIEVTAIRLRVRPPEHRPPPAPASRRTVPDEARAAMDRLAHSLPADSPLARALQRLVARAG